MTGSIHKVDWELHASFSRREVQAMAILAGFAGNVAELLRKNWPREFTAETESEVRGVLHRFQALGAQDKAFVEALNKAHAHEQ